MTSVRNASLELLAGKQSNNKSVLMVPRFKMRLILAIVGQVLFLERQEARTAQQEVCIVIPWFFPSGWMCFSRKIVYTKMK